MPTLPPELFDTLFPFLETRALWSFFHTCRYFRQSKLLTLILLERYGFWESDIYSGDIHAAEEGSFLLPIISSLHPITTLTVWRTEPCVPLHWYGLPDFVAQLNTLSDLVIYGRIRRDPGVVDILAAMSKCIHPLVIVGFNQHGDVKVSEFRRLPPIDGWDPYPSLKDLKDLRYEFTSFLDAFLFFALLLPRLIVTLITWISSIYHLCIRIYLYFFEFGTPWSQVDRIARAIEWPLFWDFEVEEGRFHVQNSPAGASSITVAIFSPSMKRLTLPPLPSLSTTQYAALLGCINYDHSLISLTVKENCSLDLHAIRNFFHRHQQLWRLDLESGSIAAESLTMATPSSDWNIQGRLSSLEVPAEYIPHVLSNEPLLGNLTIISKTAKDGPHLSSVLDFIAVAHIYTPLRTLGLVLHCGVHSKLIPPWRVEKVMSNNEEPRLGGFINLWLKVSGTRFSSVDKRGLPAWLAHCSALRVLHFSKKWVPVGKQPSLTEAINQKREAVGLAPLLFTFPESVQR
ncbi:hypothetical protein R3P38DRAFT_2843954 [Favolaschia claudopus]|uniref:F-box domain-containing protein n=1 Tax=Favolaschia claudopus TaxID=2862362 RepID=A0AAW0E3E6_9AGAR